MYAEITADKSSDSFEVTQLKPGKKYYFVLQTQTDAHERNSNKVVSEFSKVVSVTKR
ncbi:MAG: fibronectin type III domain-containing protein [bacterium]|nr:fibronectin type III domain-containing protein [bacterium]